MIVKEQLNEDQLKSFYSMTEFNGFSEEEALQLIQELCIDKGFTGLRVTKYQLTSEGQGIAWELWMERMMGTAIRDAFDQATKGKGILQYILACICVGLCFPIGKAWAVIKILTLGR